MTSRLPELEDDGLITPEVGDYAEEKYRLVGLYAELFAKSMKGKWGNRVYIDLFSGAGRSRIKNTSRIVPASPLLALNIKDRFDRYIFCELELEKIAALKLRVEREYPDVDAHYIQGNTNKNVEVILEKIPMYHPGFKVLCFCFVDPFNLENLHFETLRRMATRYVDFLVLIPSGMDANRNISKYSKEENKKVDKFIGDNGWRTKWELAEAKGESFSRFLPDQFGQRMVDLGYIYSGIQDMKPMRLTEKNVLLYHLAFFSRSELGKKFWDQARKYSADQQSLF